MAQFFATGIAAQKLAANPHAPQALKVEDTNAQVVAAEQAARKATEQALQAVGKQEVGPATDDATKLVANSVKCWNANRTAYRQAATAKLDQNSEIMKIINGDDEIAFRGAVALSISEHEQIKAINAAACQ
ncbi:hypothetical protein [Sphingomonas sp. CFBP 13720]|uniref:hypothetical protein n=1 Tax=Sphingomonas sp. CFBP 13720 TaxID=2775302 RepID=UPI00177CDBE0|nr:hypothetical protein [Sphingomonas sp. CFBP 13720]MBD8679261.1 hypothetical protein [Sphingomonas sp. CFBP 13720]